MSSQKWGYVRIISGTILGGLLGFYVMHHLEVNYKAKWDERLEKYEQEKMIKENAQFQADDTLFISDDPNSQLSTTSASTSTSTTTN